MSKKDQSNNKRVVINSNLTEEAKERVKDYVTFYRRNLNIFCEDYFDLKLHPFQHDIIYHIGVCDNNMIVASRAISKTWTLAVACSGVCVLYPDSEVVVVSSKISQAGLIVSEKIDKELRKSSPNLMREIKRIKSTATEYLVEFHNGSKLVIVPALESARGQRATFIIFEEFRLIPKDIVDGVIDPMSHPRNAPYKYNPKYSMIEPEETKMCYISSSGYTFEWIAGAIKNQITAVVNGKNYSFFAFDWYLAVKHNLKTIQDIERAKSSCEDEVTFLIEYCNILYGENVNGFFTLDMMRKAQTIKDAFYPIEKENRMSEQECYSYKDLTTNDYGEEIRILAIDIASAGGANNDNTCAHCIRGIPTANGYQREFVYSTVYNGVAPLKQVLYIKRLYKDFKADFVVFDLANQGRVFYSLFTKDMTDEETGEFHQGWTVINDDSICMVSKDVLEDLRNQTLSANALPILFPIKTNDEQNHLIAMDFKKQLRLQTIKLLIEEVEANIYLSKDKAYRELWSEEKRAIAFAPYRNNSEFITETIQLNAKYNGGKVKLTEPSGATKDRYSAGSYGNYFITIKENELMKDTNKSYSSTEYIKSMNQVVTRVNNSRKFKNKYFR